MSTLIGQFRTPCKPALLPGHHLAEVRLACLRAGEMTLGSIQGGDDCEGFGDSGWADTYYLRLLHAYSSGRQVAGIPVQPGCQVTGIPLQRWSRGLSWLWVRLEKHWLVLRYRQGCWAKTQLCTQHRARQVQSRYACLTAYLVCSKPCERPTVWDCCEQSGTRSVTPRLLSQSQKCVKLGREFSKTNCTEEAYLDKVARRRVVGRQALL